MRAPRIVRCSAFAMLALLAPLAPLAACTDGFTPDCSDAATQCGPNIDAAGDVLEAQPFPETGARDTSVVDTAVPDAGDPDADAGDEI